MADNQLNQESQKRQELSDGWQPIETVPKDGTPVLVGHVVRFKPYKTQARKQGYPEGRWQEHNGYGWQNIDWEPAEWQPMRQEAI